MFSFFISVFISILTNKDRWDWGRQRWMASPFSFCFSLIQTYSESKGRGRTTSRTQDADVSRGLRYIFSSIFFLYFTYLFDYRSQMRLGEEVHWRRWMASPIFLLFTFDCCSQRMANDGLRKQPHRGFLMEFPESQGNSECPVHLGFFLLTQPEPHLNNDFSNALNLVLEIKDT